MITDLYTPRRSERINAYEIPKGYEGPFKVSITNAVVEIDPPEGEDPPETPETEKKYYINVAEGKASLGSGVVSIDALESEELEVDTPNDFYVYCRLYADYVVGRETVLYEFKVSDTYPILEKIEVDGNTRWYYPIPCGSFQVRDGVAKNVKQLQFGNHVVAGCLS